MSYPPTCILTGAPGEDADDCTTHEHEGEPLVCSECGTVGNADDLAFLGHPCPRSWYEDDSCSGIMRRLRPRFYFTFGGAYNLRRNYVVIEAPDRTTARASMRAIYGRNYAFDYDEASFAHQPAKYGLTEVPFGTPVIQEHPL